MQHSDWNNIKIFLAIARQGGLAGAAEELGTTHSTVFRHLNDFEQELGVRLFDRHNAGYRLTEAGETVLEEAQAMEGNALAFQRQIAGKDDRISGHLRILTTHGLSIYLMEPLFKPFQDTYPDIRLSVDWGNLRQSLSNYQADIILLPSHKPPENAFGRKVADICFSLFANQAYLKRHGWPESLNDLRGYDTVAYHESFATEPFYDWYHRITQHARKRMTLNSFLTVRAALEAGYGIGLLPYIYGASSSVLVPLGPPIEGVSRPLWVLTHRDLKNTVRVRTFMDYMAAHHEVLRPQFEAS